MSSDAATRAPAQKMGLIRIATLLLACALGLAVALRPGLAARLLPAIVGAAVGGIILLRAPWLGLPILIFLSADIFFINSMVDLRLPIGGLDLRDVMVFAMWGLLGHQAIQDRGRLPGMRTPIGLLLLGFLGLGLVSALIGLREAVPRIHLFQELRVLACWSLFFPTVFLVRTKKQVVALTISYLVAGALTSSIYVLQRSFLDAQFLASAYVKSMGGIARIHGPGNTLMLMAFVIALTLLMLSRTGRKRVAYSLVVGICGLAIIVSFERNLWVAAAVAFLLLLALPPRRWDVRGLIPLALTGAVIVVMILVLNAYAVEEAASLVEGIWSRVEVMLTSRVDQVRTIEGRLVENQIAYARIRTSPLLGIGLGNRYYRYVDEAWSGTLTEDHPELPYYIHNAYAWIALKMGIPALLLLLGSLAAFLWQGYAAYRASHNHQYEPIHLAMALAGTAIMITSVIHPRLMRPEGASFMAIAMGLNEALKRIRLSETDPSPRMAEWDST